jgi:hypothetical protein
VGDVIGDLNSRHGQITAMDEIDGQFLITAIVPLANLFGYLNTLRHMTQGGARYRMAFSHYERAACPRTRLRQFSTGDRDARLTVTRYWRPPCPNSGGAAARTALRVLFDVGWHLVRGDRRHFVYRAKV